MKRSEIPILKNAASVLEYNTSDNEEVEEITENWTTGPNSVPLQKMYYAAVYKNFVMDVNDFECDNQLHVFSFQVDKPITLCGITFFGPSLNCCNFQVTVRIAIGRLIERNIIFKFCGVVIGHTNQFMTFPFPDLHLVANSTCMDFDETSYGIFFTINGPNTKCLSINDASGNKAFTTQEAGVNFICKRTDGQIGSIMFTT